MATKAELAQSFELYNEAIVQARQAIQQRRFVIAIDAAIAAFPHVDGMMQYARRWAKRETDDLEAVQIVLGFAPVILEPRYLQAVEELFRSQRRITKNTARDLTSDLGRAFCRIDDARRLWGWLESNPATSEEDLARTLGGDQAWWIWLAEAWESLGYLQRHLSGRSCLLSLRNNFEEAISAKCPACGTVCNGKRWVFWKPGTCPRCRQSVRFVLLASPVVEIR